MTNQLNRNITLKKKQEVKQRGLLEKALNKFINMIEAMFATSRSISQDLFRQRQLQKNYQTHIRNIDRITNKKKHPCPQQPVCTHTQTLHKSKSSANQFNSAENKTGIRRENRILFEKIERIEKGRVIYSSHEKLRYVSGSNQQYKKREAEEIRVQNERMAKNIEKMQSKSNKKKMEKDIKQYLQFKNQIRRFKPWDQSIGRSSSRNSEKEVIRPHSKKENDRFSGIPTPDKARELKSSIEKPKNLNNDLEFESILTTQQLKRYISAQKQKRQTHYLQQEPKKFKE